MAMRAYSSAKTHETLMNAGNAAHAKQGVHDNRVTKVSQPGVTIAANHNLSWFDVIVHQ